MGRRRSTTNTWVKQSAHPTWTRLAESHAAPMALAIPDEKIDQLIDRLREDDPHRDDWTLMVISALADDLRRLVAEGWSCKHVLSVMGKRVPHRMVEKFGANAVETLRDAEGKPFDRRVPEDRVSLPRKGGLSYAPHRLALGIVDGGAMAVSEAPARYGASPEAFDGMDFKQFLASCPPLGGISVDRAATDEGLGASVA